MMFCAKCGRRLWCSKTGIVVVLHDDGGSPTEAYSADRYACECGSDIIGSVAREPFMDVESRPDFDEVLARVAAKGGEVVRVRARV